MRTCTGVRKEYSASVCSSDGAARNASMLAGETGFALSPAFVLSLQIITSDDGSSVRQRLEKYTAHDAEHGAVGADTQRERRNRQRSKHRSPPALTQCVPQVVSNGIERHVIAPSRIPCVEMSWPAEPKLARRGSEGWPCPAFGSQAAPLGNAGRERIGNVVAGERGDAPLRLAAGRRKPLHEDSIQLLSELATEPARIRGQRDPMNRARDLDRHRFDSGRRRWARAAATWSARRRASARATVRP